MASPTGSCSSVTNVYFRRASADLASGGTSGRTSGRTSGKSSGQYSLVFLDEDYEVIRDANVRENPFRNASRVAQLKQGDRVWVIGQAKTSTATWYRVARDGAELGFVYSELLRQFVRGDTGGGLELGDEVVASRGFEEKTVVAEAQEQSTMIATVSTDLMPNSDEPPISDEPRDQWSALEMMLEKEHEAENRLSPRIRRVIQQANNGDVTAQAQLAYLYHVGEEMAIDLEKAAYWYEKAAEGGDARAQVNLALMLESGEGVPGNPIMAIRWLREAADQDNADAQQLLGYHFETGRVIETDHAQAIAFYTAAAQQGKPVAQHNLARMYQLGLGTDIDLDKARYWYNEAAVQGFEEARVKLAQFNR